MPRYSVQLPIMGYVITEVEAENGDAAVKVALEQSFTRDQIEEWEVYERTVSGNVAHGSCTQANAELVE